MLLHPEDLLRIHHANRAALTRTFPQHDTTLIRHKHPPAGHLQRIFTAALRRLRRPPITQMTLPAAAPTR